MGDSSHSHRHEVGSETTCQEVGSETIYRSTYRSQSRLHVPMRLPRTQAEGGAGCCRRRTTWQRSGSQIPCELRQDIAHRARTGALMRAKLLAEFIGTFWLVLGGCGSAVLAATFPDVGIGLVGVSLAFGLTVLTMAYTVGHISGCHLNPAVTVGLAAGGRFPVGDIGPYVVAQVIGASAAAAAVYVVASGKADWSL